MLNYYFFDVKVWNNSIIPLSLSLLLNFPKKRPILLSLTKTNAVMYNDYKLSNGVKSTSGRAKSRQEVANEYGFCTRTLRRYIKKHQIKVSKGLPTPKEQERIYTVLGRPGKR